MGMPAQISSNYQTQTDLGLSEEQEVLALLDDAVIITDNEFHILSMSGGWQNFLPDQFDNYEGCHFSSIFLDENQNNLDISITQAKQLGHSKCKATYIHLDNKICTAEISFHQICGGKKMACIMRDISDFNAISRDLAAKTTQLFQVERIVGLNHFSATLAEELHQPLTAIGLYSNAAYQMVTLQQKLENEQLQNLGELLKNISHQCSKSVNTMQRTRQYINAEERSNPNRSLSHMIQTSFDMLRTVASDKDVKLDFALMAEDVSLNGDTSVALEQVLYNLGRVFINLLDNDEPEGKQSEVKLLSNTSNDDLIISLVSDRPVDLELIIDRMPEFYLRPDAQPYAISLSIAKQVLAQFNGKLTSENNQKELRITLPNIYLKALGKFQ